MRAMYKFLSRPDFGYYLDLVVGEGVPWLLWVLGPVAEGKVRIWSRGVASMTSRMPSGWQITLRPAMAST